MTNDELLAALAKIALDSSQELKRGGNAAMLDLLLVGRACNEAYLRLRDTHGAVREWRKESEPTVTYRGSGTDLATDLRAIVPPEKLQDMADALVDSGHVKLTLPLPKGPLARSIRTAEARGDKFVSILPGDLRALLAEIETGRKAQQPDASANEPLLDLRDNLARALLDEALRLLGSRPIENVARCINAYDVLMRHALTGPAALASNAAVER